MKRVLQTVLFLIISNISVALADASQRVALLLPLSGPLAKQAQAIKNGFFAAYYAAKATQVVPEISVMDTNQSDINNLYEQAEHSGVQLIVGPLEKTDIEKIISRQRLGVPTLALNTIPAASAIHNLYQFGLAPDDAANQVAEKIIADKHTRVLVLTPSNEWGQRIESVFEPVLTKLGGKIVAKLSYDSPTELANQVKELLYMDKSAQRITALKWALKEKIRVIPYHRSDFDAIFIAANPNMGRQIVPLLRFYYLNTVPLYSITDIYSSHTNAQLDRDLEGTIFNEIPWLFDSTPTLTPEIISVRANCKTAWPESFSQYPRFFALGVDAFRLMFQLGTLASSPLNTVPGATGILSMQPNGQISRKMIWAKFVAGQANLLPY